MSDQTPQTDRHRSGTGSPLDTRTHQDLLSRIHDGTYALGERLPPENDEAAILKKLRAAIEAGETAFDLDMQFHARLAQMSGNTFLVDSLRMLRHHWLFVGDFVSSLSPTGYKEAKRRLGAPGFQGRLGQCKSNVWSPAEARSGKVRSGTTGRRCCGGSISRPG